MSKYSHFEVLVFLFGIGLSFIVGFAFGMRAIRADACKAGVAEYAINDYGRPEFRFKKIQPCP